MILILIHVYFGRYRDEELGWNSAFGNSISLLWVSIILFKFLLDKYSLQELYFGNQYGKFLLISLLALWVLILFVFNFFHVLPKKLAFIVSSASSVYILAYIVISLIVGDFSLNKEIVFSSLLLFVILLGIIQIINYLIPAAKETKQKYMP